jgi:prepilin-type N-terminal cleavage/methylation domain-containing protein
MARIFSCRGSRVGCERLSTIKHQTSDIKLRSRGFTLLEMLVVMGIISGLLVALIPAVTSLSKSNGRRAAVSALLGAIEQARAEAIKTGQATYVVFPIFTNGTQSTLDRYNYKSYAIFEDDAANPGSVKQLTTWNPLPAGVALRSGGTAALSNLAGSTSLSPVPTFTFTPDLNAAATATYRCLKFNLNGEIEAPIAPPANVLFAVFEGYVSSNGSEVITGANDGSGNPLAAEYLMISRMTGRAEPTAAPTP